MRLVSINTARVQEVVHNDAVVRTGIFKKPVEGPVRLRALGLDGDEQADHKHHGGEHMAVYAYAAQGYEHWRRALGQPDLPYGKLGDNLTIDGLTDETVCVGDTFGIGRGSGANGSGPGSGAVVQVSLPRAPCSKLAMTMNSKEFVKTFLESLRLGWYMRVLQEGEIAAGDDVVRLSQDPARLSIAECARLKYFDQGNLAGTRRAASVEALGPTWKQMFAKRAEELASSGAT